MTPAVPQVSIGAVVVILLIVWRMYVRIKRMVGRQKSKIYRHWITLIVFPLLVAMFALAAIGNPVTEGIFALGLATGVGLAIWGLRMTKFETTPLAYYYTPNAHIGIALSVLMMGRIMYRFYQAYSPGAGQPGTSLQDFGRSPLTLAIFGTLAAYYITYAIGIIRWRWNTPLPGSIPDPPKPAEPEVKP